MHGTNTEGADMQAWFKVKASHTVGQLERKEMLGTV